MIVRFISVENDGVVRLAINGPVTAREIQNDAPHPLDATIGDRWPRSRVVLGMADAPFIDSTAIGWLLSCQKKFREGGGSFVLHSVTPQVQEVFDILKVNRVIPLARDERGAVQLAQGEDHE